MSSWYHPYGDTGGPSSLAWSRFRELGASLLAGAAGLLVGLLPLALLARHLARADLEGAGWLLGGAYLWLFLCLDRLPRAWQRRRRRRPDDAPVPLPARARARLERRVEAVAARGEGPVELALASSGHLPGVESPLMLGAGLLACLHGLVTLAALVPLDGLTGVVLGKAFFGVPILLLLAATRVDMPTFVLLIGTAHTSLHALGRRVLGPELARAPHFAMEAILIALTIVAARRYRRHAVASTRPRLLVKVGGCWRLASLPFLFGDGPIEVLPLDPARPASASPEDQGWRLELPLEGGGVTGFLLSTRRELELLVEHAPPGWSDLRAGLTREAPRTLPSLRLASVLLLLSVAMAELPVAALDTLRQVVPLLSGWSAGRPRPLLEVSRRMRTRHPWMLMPRALEGLVLLDMGRYRAAREAFAPVEGLSGGYGQAARTVRTAEANLGDVIDAASAIEAAVTTRPAPAGEDPESSRSLEHARALVELGDRRGPLTLDRSCQALRVVELLGAAWEVPGPHRRPTGLLLAGIMGRARWPLEVSTRDFVPWGIDDAWSAHALSLLDELAAGDAGEASRLRARVLFRAERFPEALPAIEASELPSDRLLAAALLGLDATRREEALLRVRRVRAGSPDVETDADLLEALLLARGGRVEDARVLLEAASGEGGSRARRAHRLAVLLRHQLGEGLSAGDLELPEGTPEPPLDEPSSTSSWREWMLDADLDYLAGIEAGWRPERGAHAAPGSGRGFVRLPGLGWYPGAARAREMLATP